MFTFVQDLLVATLGASLFGAWQAYWLVARLHGWRSGLFVAVRRLWYGAWVVAGLAVLAHAPVWGFLALLVILGIPALRVALHDGLLKEGR
ncbi:MAG: hypothetical protein H0X24_21255 [Ktedonobacterales bacterium]|nr:hypothetical protein [Ktedonobacterales bacterium]